MTEVENLSSTRALGMCCDDSVNAVRLYEQGWQVIKTNFPESPIDKGVQLAARRGVQVKSLTAAATILQSEVQFDLVTSFNVQLSFSEHGNMLPMAARVLATGGTLPFIRYDNSSHTSGWTDEDLLSFITSDEAVSELQGLNIGQTRGVEEVGGEHIAHHHHSDHGSYGYTTIARSVRLTK